MDFWTSSLPLDDEFEKLVIRMNPPRVTVDNTSSRTTTLIKVDSANKRGSLLEVVQVLTDMNLIVRRAYISSDGGWFMDVFHVTDQNGKKCLQEDVADRIQQSLGPRVRSFRSVRRSVGVQAAAEHTTIELTGRDRPGLLSEVFAILADLKCNVVAAEVWTHNSRMASVVYFTDDETGLPIDNPERLAKIKHLLLYVLRGDIDKKNANTAIDRSYYSILFAHSLTCSMLSTMELSLLKDQKHISSEAERQRVIHCLEAAVRRRTSEGIKLELSGEDRFGLLSDVTRIFRENGLSVCRAEVTTRGSQAMNVFYVTDVSGNPVKSETIEAVRNEIGLTILRVKDEPCSKSPSRESGKFSLRDLVRSRSERFLYNLGHCLVLLFQVNKKILDPVVDVAGDSYDSRPGQEDDSRPGKPDLVGKTDLIWLSFDP
ncbi:hypothetical protein TSUD_171410 [Trifolium subterraneum]|uniref:ACT domain-containing protein ACR n=1 Tax=Trifolium subterraneum TaxID=3900 RepID=A0A2Z6LJS9_TRISU|nr:hypothetical protein TSUD_171410 [Trifolium subterraneum]